MLTPDGCRERQHRFLARLEEAHLPAALVSHPRDIYYLTGVLPEMTSYPYPSLLFLGPGQRSWLATGHSGGEPVVDELLEYPTSEMGTVNPDNCRRLAELIRPPMRRTTNLSGIGFQRESLSRAIADSIEFAGAPRDWVPIDEILQDLQLRKDADEIACIKNAIGATLAGYTRAQQVIEPGRTELEVMTECQTAAQRHSGHHHYYNGDFQSNNPGGFARNRKIEAGELYIIDAWSDVSGYWCDMARAWVVGGEPSKLQAEVYEHLAGILMSVPKLAKAGESTQEFWRTIDARVREHPHLAKGGLTHHAGHGIGVRVHEGPDLNRDRGGTFEVGNVFTCEPGAYSQELRRGIRLENLFHVTDAGVEVLSPYPLSIIPDRSLGQ